MFADGNAMPRGKRNLTVDEVNAMCISKPASPSEIPVTEDIVTATTYGQGRRQGVGTDFGLGSGAIGTDFGTAFGASRASALTVTHKAPSGALTGVTAFAKLECYTAGRDPAPSRGMAGVLDGVGGGLSAFVSGFGAPGYSRQNLQILKSLSLDVPPLPGPSDGGCSSTPTVSTTAPTRCSRRSLAARATPWAWLPAEAATTPRFFSSLLSWLMRL